MFDSPTQSPEYVFENPNSQSGTATIYIIVGGGLILLAIVNFILAIFFRTGQWALHLGTTLPIIMSIGMFAQGFSLRRLPQRISIDREALTVSRNHSKTRYAWSDIGSATSQNMMNSHKTFLNITDNAGKAIVRVDDSFPDYDCLVELVQTYVDAKPIDTSLRIMSRKARFQGIGALIFGCFLGVAALFIAYDTHETQRTNTLLSVKGAPGDAEIVRLFVAPNGVTRRLEYRIAGSEVKNVEVEPEYWEELQSAQTVPVFYVPEEPNISRLEYGEVPDDFIDPQAPMKGYLLAGIGGLITLFFIVYSPFAWLGYDLAYDGTPPTWKIKRFGRPISQLRKNL